MPQLNPDPWLIIFLFSWTSLICLAPYKIMKFNLLKTPVMKPKKLYSNHWIWPW